MDEKKYGVLLKALKACEKNYHSHVREFGKARQNRYIILGRTTFRSIPQKDLKEHFRSTSKPHHSFPL